MSKANQKGIRLNDIYTGTVVLLKEKIVGEGKDSVKGYVSSLELRKIVFEMKGTNGVDITSGLNKSDKYAYKVIDCSNMTEKDESYLKNNTIIITNPQKVGSVLSFIGFPKYVQGSDVKEISKILLSEDKVIQIRKHDIKLGQSKFINLEEVQKANAEASNLYKFKVKKLSTKVQPVEKAYVKYFA